MFLALRIVFVVFVAACPAKASYCQYDMYPHKHKQYKQNTSKADASPKAI